MKASQARAEQQLPVAPESCDVCGDKTLAYGLTQDGQVCSRKCSDTYDNNKYKANSHD